MVDPQVTWYVVEDGVLTPYEEYYAGSYRPNNTMDIVLKVWNNRWGQTAIANISNSKIAVFFDTIEDAYLLNLCSIKIDNGSFRPLTISSNRGRVDMTKILYGTPNTGSDGSTNNYATITLRFGPIPEGVRNSLKNVFVDIEFDN